MVEVVVHAITFDPKSNQFVVILKDIESQDALPIWIGPFEGSAIAMGLRQTYTFRPMTHDFIKNILDGIFAKLKKVVITELKGDTFFAKAYIEIENYVAEIDARPSDAIALAVRTDAKIYVAKRVMDEAKIKLPEIEEEELMLSDMDTDDVKYEM